MMNACSMLMLLVCVVLIASCQKEKTSSHQSADQTPIRVENGRWDVPPKPLTDAGAIKYPEELFSRGVEGTTVVQLNINEFGVITGRSLLRSSNYKAFDDTAVDAFRNIVFSPARLAGKPVSCTVQMPVHFRLPHDRIDRSNRHTTSKNMLIE